MNKRDNKNLGLVICAFCGQLIYTLPTEKVTTIYSYCRADCKNK